MLNQIKTVLWSLIGLAPRQDKGAEGRRGNPLMLVAIAFVVVLLFLVTIAFIAHSVANG